MRKRIKVEHTTNCQYKYRTTGETCGAPPQWRHIESGRDFCQFHFTRLQQVHRGWVNLERADAQAIIDQAEAAKRAKESA